MKLIRHLLWILPLLLLVGLTACAGGPPPLAETGRPTLVFIYTDG